MHDDLTDADRLCSTVHLLNRDTSTQDYDDDDFAIQSPRGNVSGTALVYSGGINSGELVHNGTTSGRVCFVDATAPGLYVVSWTPDSDDDPRAVWLFERG
ncbi:hypothetical protein [Jatrophihabitans sp.]|uniref:hypothetical protein n=1 Tax=Jatrophihabitans sp. TaxID=1932789 RepID=UPI0030C75BEE